MIRINHGHPKFDLFSVCGKAGLDSQFAEFVREIIFGGSRMGRFLDHMN